MGLTPLDPRPFDALRGEHCDGNDREQKKEHEQKDAARELIEREQGVAAMEQRDEKRRKEEGDVRWR
jgi:hypothetical protein